MTSPGYDAFLAKWKLENIKPLPDYTDPSDVRFVIQRRATELTEAAAKEGFSYDLELVARAKGGTVKLVETMYEWAAFCQRLDGPDAT
jgi:hypothetical protein